MIEIVIALVVSFLLTAYATPIIIKVSKLKKLYDEPDDRKVHKEPISSLGGVAMFTGIVIALLFSVNFMVSNEFQYYLAAFIVLFFTGLKDDILTLNPIKKLLGQIIAVVIILLKCNLLISNLHGLFGIYTLPISVSYVFTFMVFLFIINAFNLIDGVDGLAGSLTLLSSLVFGIYFYLNNQTAYVLLATAISGAVIGFLLFNIQPAKIFMGDTGALLLGLCMAIMATKFIEIAQTPNIQYSVNASPVVALGIIIVPIIDTMRVFLIRFFKKTSPFSPDKKHFHHILLSKGLSHNLVTLACVFINIVFIILVFLGQGLGPNLLFLGLMVLAFGGIAIIQAAQSIYKPAMRVVQGKKDAELTKQTNTVVENISETVNGNIVSR